jgi:putative phage-type endonuclease
MSYTIITGPESVQGSEEWLEFRRSRIGASQAAAILGIDPWITKLQLWENIVYNQSKPVTAAMQRGKDLEGAARVWLSNLMDTPYESAVLASNEYPGIIASLDGFCELPDGNVAIAEIKVPNKDTHQKAIDGIIPDHYYAQMQHQMVVAGVKSMLYCSFDGQDGVVLPCLKDEKYCSILISKELAFLSSVINFDPPEASDRDWKDIVDPNQVMKVFEYKQLKDQKMSLDQRLDEIVHDLTSKTSSARMKLDDFRMRKVAGRTLIDYKSILEDLQIEPSEKYMKRGKDYWKITC